MAKNQNSKIEMGSKTIGEYWEDVCKLNKVQRQFLIDRINAYRGWGAERVTWETLPFIEIKEARLDHFPPSYYQKMDALFADLAKALHLDK